MEVLPGLPPSRRIAAARAFLARPTHALAPDEQARILEETLQVLDHPEWSALFGPDSRAEVPIVGLLETLRGSEVVSGQVDRLLIENGRVLIVDYKSNRPPPREESDVPAPYLRQMASYRALLQPIYPEKSIHCHLLWTSVPRLMQLSDVISQITRLDARRLRSLHSWLIVAPRGPTDGLIRASSTEALLHRHRGLR